MQCNRQTRRGVTLIEVLVVLGITALLLAIVIPAVMYARATARLTECRNNLRQIGVATQAYVTAKKSYPTRGFRVALLPYMEQQELYALVRKHVDDSMSIYHKKRPPGLLCPATLNPREWSSSYFVNAGTGFLRAEEPTSQYGKNGPSDGMAYVAGSSRPPRPSEVTDGLSFTANYSEMAVGRPYRKDMHPDDIRTVDEYRQFVSDCQAGRIPQYIASVEGDWHTGGLLRSEYNHVLAPNSYVCGNNTLTLTIATASGDHQGGVNVVMADGAVRFVANGIDLSVWRAIGSRNGGEVVSDF